MQVNSIVSHLKIFHNYGNIIYFHLYTLNKTNNKTDKDIIPSLQIIQMLSVFSFQAEDTVAMTRPARKQRAKEIKVSQIGLIIAFGKYAYKTKIGIF
jgi:hypothetical protein